MEELREAAIVKSLSKRSDIALCVHGINKRFCTTCANKKPAKSTKSKKAAAEGAAPAAEASAEPAKE
jgi:hypothetical protein